MKQTNSTSPGLLSRRNFLRGTAALGIGAALLGTSAASASASAGPTRTSYEILEGTYYETTVYVYDSGVAGPTTMVVGGIHGDEKSGYLAADQIAEWSVTTGKLVVMPRANVDAIARDVRPYDPDLNRQFPPTGGTCLSSLARNIWNVVEAVDPDWVFDLHSSRGIYKSGDGGVGQALFPTWTDPARSYGEQTVAALNDRFGLSGDVAYRMGNTLDADRPMLMHRVAGMLDRPGFICETTEKMPLDEQTQWHLFTVEHVMAQYGHVRGTPETTTRSTVDFHAGTHTFDDYWQSFEFDHSLSYPAIVAPSLSYAGPDPAHPRITDDDSNGATARVEEWAYLNDRHYQESAGVLAFPANTVTRSDDGKRIQASRQNVGTSWEYIEFEEPFEATPVVLAAPQSDWHDTPVIARVRNVTRYGFDVRLHTEEGGRDLSWSEQERVGWVALEEGRGTLNGRNYEVGTRRMDEEWRWIDFAGSYENPVFLAAPTTYAGWNPVTVRYEDLSGSRVKAFLQEETSADAETGHPAETVGYFVIDG
ncbi:succinylglutamate desuccinylase/aspartoacylase family protein [Haloarchaeobius sp. HME9146]|uniref:succinylglutamate desuccinylase/aspartoacylase domain-containing protein n=1 Tax=Haloarchaeobius sp. HME9146 TaxID=2978732 RepID=UPI0021C1DE4F|nr:succinylglutamate desuccinylase/aspartoacylase family protein [Haloarchaeobius sp. HME9146]MCT9095656.1 succinylglutamate desuccinylase/aspartoacylase family protein [Haloarchaeobius sp. HME9146]